MDTWVVVTSWLLWIILECWNVGVQIILQDSDFISFVYIPQGESAGSYGDYFYFLKNIHAVFCNNWIILHSTNSAQVSLLHVLTNTCYLVFLMIAIMVGVQ